MTTNALDRIVEVVATISAGRAQGADFGRVLVVTTDPSISANDRVRTFDDFTAVSREFASGSVLEAARQYFRQDPAPPPLKVGKWFKVADASTLVASGATTVAALRLLAAGTLTLNGVALPNMDLSASTLSTFALLNAEIARLINANAAFTGVSVSEANGVLTLTLGGNGTFTGTPTGTVATTIGWDDGTIFNGHAAETADEAMTAIVTQDNFYWVGVASDISIPADIVGIADWVTANELKYMVWEENSPGALAPNETTSTFAMLAAKSANHLAVIYGGTDDGKDMAIEAQFSEVDFNGLNTLLVSHGKVLTGSAGDALTSAQIAEIERKNGSYYQKLGVGGFVVGGKATSGQWIDVVYALDWMKGTMQVEVFNALTRSRRVPQTPAGLIVVEAAVRGVCEQAFRLGMIDGGLFTPTVTGIIRRATGDQGFSGETVKGYYIYIGSLAAQSQTDREARKAPPISVWLKGQGAIQFARVDLLFEN